MTEVYTDKKTDETKVVPEGELALASKFDKQPVLYNCQNCGNTGYTIVEQNTTALAYLFMVIMIFAFGLFFSLLLLPFIFFLTRTFTHKCSTCLQEVGSDNKLLGGVFNLQDKIVSINVGELGIVLTRKIILGFFLVVLLFIILYISVSGHHHHHHHRIIPIETTWEDFLKECGRENLHKEGDSQRIKCEFKYSDRTVQNWRGYVIRIDDFRESLMKFMHHAVGVLIKMEPSESEYFPDIILAMDSEVASDHAELLNSINRGSEIIFNATFMSIGSDSKTRHAHIVSMQRGSGFKDIPMHVHEQGRYGDRPRFFKGAAIASTQPVPQLKDESKAQAKTP